MAPRKRTPKTAQPTYDPQGSVPAPNVPKMMGVDDTNWTGEVTTEAGKKVERAIRFNAEYGVPGLKHWFGRLYEEFLPDLADDKGKRAFHEMGWNEPTVASFLYAIKMIVRQVTWTVSPPSGDEAPEQLERAKFIDGCLQDLDMPWTAVVTEVLWELLYGFSLLEMVFKVRRGRKADPPSNHDDGMVGWAKLAPRHQETIWRWELDPHGKVVAVIQWAPPTWQFMEIPAQKLLHFKTDEWHASPEGLSVLRGAWVPYELKKTIQMVEAIAIERDGCGVPVARMPAERMRMAEDTTTEEGQECAAELAALQKLVRDIKTDEQRGIVFPIEHDTEGHEIYALSLMSTAGARTVDSHGVIQRYKQEIASAVLADFLLFGHETSGTQAMGRSRKDLFVLTIDAVVDGICGTMNRQGIPLLCEANGWEGPFPVLGHQPLDDIDLSVLGPFLETLAGLGIDLSDPETERHLRRVADLPVPEIEGSRK